MSGSSGRLAGKHALVTGAGTGIGRAIALRLAREGAALTLVGRRAAPLEETAGLADGDVGVHAADVRERAALDGALRDAAASRGPLDIVVANAGIGGPNGPGFQAEGEEDRFDELVATNLAGTYRTFRAALSHLRPVDADAAAPERRHLVAISSILARIGVVGYSGYSASKAGITGLVRAMAMELAPEEVQVNAVAPGWVDTAMAREGLEGMAAGMGITPEEAHRVAMQDVPLGRMGDPEDIAGLVSWLVSPDGRGVTGQTIDMNGGAFML